jgi:hypothetical protein
MYNQANTGGNLEAILTGWLDALRYRDLDAVERRLDPGVVWRGSRGSRVPGQRRGFLPLFTEVPKGSRGCSEVPILHRPGPMRSVLDWGRLRRARVRGRGRSPLGRPGAVALSLRPCEGI